MSLHNSQCLVVLGMHRSGTSALAGCLKLLGAELGTNIMPAHMENELGFYENHDLMLIHETLFRDLGCRWDMVGNLPTDWYISESAQKAKDKIKRLIQREFSDTPLFLLKDPRICRLMPLWLQVFDELEVKPKFIFMIRHPAEVAASLQNRDGFSLLKGHLLWLCHMRDALTSIQYLESALLTYDQLIADPIHVLEILANKLQVVFPRSIRNNYESIAEFIQPNLKHNNVNEEISSQYSAYSWIYDQIKLSSYSGIAIENTPGDSTGLEPQLISELQTIHPFLLPVPKEQKSGSQPTFHASSIIGNMLSIISGYEQDQLDYEKQRQRRLIIADQHGKTLYAQIFFPQEVESVYSENDSCKILLTNGEWEKIVVDIPRADAMTKNPLRLDPLNTQGIIKISGITIYDKTTNESILSINKKEDLDELKIKKDGFKIPGHHSLTICATGHDPIVHFPLLDDLPDKPLCLEVWINASRDLKLLEGYCLNQQNKLDSYLTELSELRDAMLRSDLQKKQLQSHIEKLKEENNLANEGLHQEKEKLANQVLELQQKLDQSKEEVEQGNAKLIDLDNQLEKQKSSFDSGLRKAFTTLESERISLKQAENQVDNYKQRLLEKESEVEKLFEINQQLLTKKGDLEEKLRYEVYNKTSLIEAKRIAEEKLYTCQEELTKITSLLKESSQHNEELNLNLGTLKEQMNKKLEEKDNAINSANELAFNYEQKNIQQEKIIAAIREEKEKLSYEAAEQKGLLKKIQKKWETEKKARSTLEKENNQLKQELKNSFDEKVRLTKLIRDQEALEQKIASIMEKIGQIIITFGEYTPQQRLPKRKLSKLSEKLEKTGVFDPDWYLEQNKDVADQGMDPFKHYIMYGVVEGREPFDAG